MRRRSKLEQKDRAAFRRLELEAAPGDIVRVWLKPDVSDPRRCFSILGKLLHYRTAGRNRAAARYRFLGAYRDRETGLDYLCMSFCLVRNPPTCTRQAVETVRSS